VAIENPKFEQSYERLFGEHVTLGPQADDFFVAFYRRFLRDSEVEEMFVGSDMPRQVQMLRRSLFQFVTYYLVGEVTPEIARLAQLHNARQISHRMFDVWMEALLETVEEFDPHYDETVRLAWGWALSPGVTMMKIYMSNPWASEPEYE